MSEVRPTTGSNQVQQVGEDHLAHLLPPAPPPLYATLIQGIKDLIHPPKLPPLEITSKPVEVPEMKGMYSGNEWKAGLISTTVNVGIIGLLLLIGTNETVQQAIKEQVVLIAPSLKPAPRIPPKEQLAQGGGGQRTKLEATKGNPPKAAPRQFLPPTITPVDNPKLPMTPTIVASADLPSVDSSNLGDPFAGLGIPGAGTGLGTGIGPGKGPGVGPGSGGGFGGGACRPGGGVSLPVPTFKPEPEYSEEARKAKYQGTVMLQIVVDEKGVPKDIRVLRKLGLGLDEKAIEAVSKWRFKPGMKDGKPVAVIATIEVSFRLL